MRGFNENASTATESRVITKETIISKFDRIVADTIIQPSLCNNDNIRRLNVNQQSEKKEAY